MKQLHRCIKCLKPDHSNNQCSLPATCSHCSEQHPFVLCPKKFGQQANQSSRKAITAHSEVIASKRVVLLKSVKAIICNPINPNIQAEALILLDDGSTTSYVSTKFAKQLELKPIASETLKLLVFNSQSTNNIPTKLVCFNVETTSGNFIALEAHSMSHLTMSVLHCEINTLTVSEF